MTFDELKAKYAAMRPLPWKYDGLFIYDAQGYSICECTVPAQDVSDRLMGGIVALHNAFPALAERYEAMREALEEANARLGGHSTLCGSYWTSDDDTTEHFDPTKCDCGIGAALALVAKPLTNAP